MRKVHSHARPGNRSRWGKNNRSGNRGNGRDDEQGDGRQQPEKEMTYVSLISDDEEDGGDIATPSNKRNVSHVDDPNNGPVRKKVASGSGSGSNSSPFSADDSALGGTADMALRMSPMPQGRNIVGQLTAQLHQKQDENSQLLEKIDDMRLTSADKDAEIASLREIIQAMQQSTDNSAHGIANPAKQNASEQPVQQPTSMHQTSPSVANQPCGTCADSDALKQKLAEAQVSLTKTRNTVADQHDQIKALAEQVSSNKTALLEERATVAQHKASIDQLNQKLAAEEASSKNLQKTLSNNQAVIDQLNLKAAAEEATLAAQTKDLNAARTAIAINESTITTNESTITMNESTIKDLMEKLEYTKMQVEGGLNAWEDHEELIEKLNETIKNLKKQVAGSDTELQQARTTIEDLKRKVAYSEVELQIAGSQGSASESATRDKDDGKDGAPQTSKIIKQLQLQLQQAEQAIEKSTARAEKAEKELEKASQATAELTKEGHKSQDDEESLRTDLKTVWQATGQMEIKFEKKEKELADLKALFEQQQEKVAECEAKLQQQRQAFDQEKEELNAQIKSLRDDPVAKEAESAPQMESLNSELESLKEQLFYMESERDEFAKEVEKHAQKETQQRDQDDAMRTAFEVSQAHATLLRSQVEARNAQVADLEEKLKALQAQVDAANTWRMAAAAEHAQAVEKLKKDAETKQKQFFAQASANLQQQRAIMSQQQERIRQYEATDQSHIIRNREARIMELQGQLYAAQNTIDPRVISQNAQIGELQSALQLKNDELKSISEQLDRVFNQYQDLSDEKAENRKKITELERRNYDLAGLLQRTMEGRDRALQELADTKAALEQTERDLDFTKRQADAIDEGGDPEFAYMESAWEPKLRDAQAQHEAAARERDEALQQVTDLAAQLESLSKERDDLNQQLEATRAELAEIQDVVQELTSQLPETDNSEVDPAVKETLEKARGIQTANDITPNRTQRVPRSSMLVDTLDGLSQCHSFITNTLYSRRSIGDEDEHQFLMPARTSPLPESAVKAAKKEQLEKMIRELEKSHEETEETVRKLIIRLKGKTIKAQALEKELKVHKALLQTKDKLIDQATARLSGGANPGKETTVNIDVDLDESGGGREPQSEQEGDLKQQEDVDMEDAQPSQTPGPSQNRTLVVTFGPTRRGYKVWKAGELSKDFDRFEGNTSYALKVAFMTEKGRRIYFALRKYNNPSMNPAPSSVPPTTTTETPSAATQAAETQATATQPSSPPYGAPPLSPTTQPTATTVRPSPLPPLPPSPNWALSTTHNNLPTINQETSTSTALYPAPTPRGRGTRGRFGPTGISRFQRTSTTLAGPGQPRAYSAPQSWGGRHEDVDIDVLASQFTMESIEEPGSGMVDQEEDHGDEEEEEEEEEDLRGKGKGKARARGGRRSEGEY
ncbi:hypothetical protein QBC40DRAFT_176121 [Triangularia verruculosa]|uniref:Uncharacterized protein n=1 Tax=Triangularia verruculosa TaxID=2587418 RepID=A0AAN6XFD7_9PEZI|nr:hypothetical protein QBC40DRAFT_176121 [Triangularia verruculosa]